MAEGVQLDLEIDDDQTSVARGSVFLYSCNLTTFCRQVVLSSPADGLPLVIKASQFSRPDLSFVFSTAAGEVLLYKFTLIPKNRFHINHIKMAQRCLVSAGKCQPLDFQPLVSTKFSLTEPGQPHQMLHLTSQTPDAFISVARPASHETDSHMLILTYHQPDHPSVNVSVEVDGVHKGHLQAAYCPSTTGCRGIVLFGENGEEVFEASDIRQVRNEY